MFEDNDNYSYYNSYSSFQNINDLEDSINEYSIKEKNTNNENKKIENLSLFTGFTSNNHNILNSENYLQNIQLLENSRDENSLFNKSFIPNNKAPQTNNFCSENNKEKPYFLDNINKGKKKDNSAFAQKEKELLNIVINNNLENKKTNKKGRKPKNLNENRKHNKLTYDNLTKRNVNIMIEKHRIYLNSLITKKYKNKIDDEKEFKLLKLTKRKNNIKDNRELKDKNWQEIFSFDISKRFKKCCKKFSQGHQHNKELIETLLKKEELEEEKILTKVFKLRYKESLLHFTGKQILTELEGMETLKDILSNLGEDKAYKDKLEKSYLNFEELLGKKRPRIKNKIK